MSNDTIQSYLSQLEKNRLEIEKAEKIADESKRAKKLAALRADRQNIELKLNLEQNRIEIEKAEQITDEVKRARKLLALRADRKNIELEQNKIEIAEAEKITDEGRRARKLVALRADRKNIALKLNEVLLDELEFNNDNIESTHKNALPAEKQQALKKLTAERTKIYKNLEIVYKECQGILGPESINKASSVANSKLIKTEEAIKDLGKTLDPKGRGYTLETFNQRNKFLTLLVSEATKEALPQVYELAEAHHKWNHAHNSLIRNFTAYEEGLEAAERTIDTYENDIEQRIQDYDGKIEAIEDQINQLDQKTNNSQSEIQSKLNEVPKPKGYIAPGEKAIAENVLQESPVNFDPETLSKEVDAVVSGEKYNNTFAEVDAELDALLQEETTTLAKRSKAANDQTLFKKYQNGRIVKACNKQLIENYQKQLELTTKKHALIESHKAYLKNLNAALSVAKTQSITFVKANYVQAVFNVYEIPTPDYLSELVKKNSEFRGNFRDYEDYCRNYGLEEDIQKLENLARTKEPPHASSEWKALHLKAKKALAALDSLSTKLFRVFDTKKLNDDFVAKLEQDIQDIKSFDEVQQSKFKTLTVELNKQNAILTGQSVETSQEPKKQLSAELEKEYKKLLKKNALLQPENLEDYSVRTETYDKIDRLCNRAVSQIDDIDQFVDEINQDIDSHRNNPDTIQKIKAGMRAMALKIAEVDVQFSKAYEKVIMEGNFKIPKGLADGYTILDVYDYQTWDRWNQHLIDMRLKYDRLTIKLNELLPDTYKEAMSEPSIEEYLRDRRLAEYQKELNKIVIVEDKIFLKNSLKRIIFDLEYQLKSIPTADPTFDARIYQGMSRGPSNIPLSIQGKKKVNLLKQIHEAKSLLDFLEKSNDFALLKPDDFKDALAKIEIVLTEKLKAVNTKLQNFEDSVVRGNHVDELKKLQENLTQQVKTAKKYQQSYDVLEVRLKEHFDAVLKREVIKLNGGKTGAEQLADISPEGLEKGIKKIFRHYNYKGGLIFEFGVFKVDLGKSKVGFNANSPTVKAFSDFTIGKIQQFLARRKIYDYATKHAAKTGGGSTKPEGDLGKSDFTALDHNQKPNPGSQKWFSKITQNSRTKLLNVFKTYEGQISGDMALPAKNPFLQDLRRALVDMGYDVKNWAAKDWQRMVKTLRSQAKFIRDVSATVGAKVKPHAIKFYSFAMPKVARSVQVFASAAPKLKHMPFKTSAAFLMMRDVGMIANDVYKGNYARAAITSVQLGVMSQIANPKRLLQAARVTGFRGFASAANMLKKAGPLVYITAGYYYALDHKYYINKAVDASLALDLVENDPSGSYSYADWVSWGASKPFFFVGYLLHPVARKMHNVYVSSTGMSMEMPEAYSPEYNGLQWQKIRAIKAKFLNEQLAILQNRLDNMTGWDDPYQARSNIGEYRRMLDNLCHAMAPQMSTSYTDRYIINKKGDLDHKTIHFYDINPKNLADVLLVYKVSEDIVCILEPLAVNQFDENGLLQNNGIFMDTRSFEDLVKTNPSTLYIRPRGTGIVPNIGKFDGSILVDLNKDLAAVQEYLDKLPKAKDGLVVSDPQSRGFRYVYYGDFSKPKLRSFEFSDPFFKHRHDFHLTFPEYKKVHHFTDVKVHEKHGILVSKVNTKNQMIDIGLKDRCFVHVTPQGYIARNHKGDLLKVGLSEQQLGEFSAANKHLKMTMVSHQKDHMIARSFHQHLIVKKDIGLVEIGGIFHPDLVQDKNLNKLLYVKEYTEYVPTKWMLRYLPPHKLKNYISGMDLVTHYALVDADNKILEDETSQYEFIKKLENYQDKILLCETGAEPLKIYAPSLNAASKRQFLRGMKAHKAVQAARAKQTQETPFFRKVKLPVKSEYQMTAGDRFLLENVFNAPALNAASKRQLLRGMKAHKAEQGTRAKQIQEAPFFRKVKLPVKSEYQMTAGDRFLLENVFNK